MNVELSRRALALVVSSALMGVVRLSKWLVFLSNHDLFDSWLVLFDLQFVSLSGSDRVDA